MSDIYYLNLIFKQRRFGVKILFEFSATPFSALQQTQLKSTVYTSGPGEERERCEGYNEKDERNEKSKKGNYMVAFQMIYRPGEGKRIGRGREG